MSQQAQSFRTIGNASTTSDRSIDLTNSLLNAIIGSGAATQNITGTENTILGTDALYSSTGGSAVVAVGYFAAQGLLSAMGAVCVGDRVAPVMLHGYDSVIVGYQAAANVLGAQGSVLIGPSVTTTPVNQFVVTNDVGIGSGTVVSGTGTTCMGALSSASGDNSVCLGYCNAHSAAGGITIGSFCTNSGAGSIVIGAGLASTSGTNNLIIVAGSGLGRLNIQNVLTGSVATDGKFNLQIATASGSLTLKTALGVTVSGGMRVDTLSAPAIKVTSSTGPSSWTITLATRTDAWADLVLTSVNGTQVSFCDDFVPGVLNFTAQHRCVFEGDPTPLPGSVLIATGRYSGLDGSCTPMIDEAVPVVSLSTTARDSRVFGVVSCMEEHSLARRMFRVGSMGFSVPRSGPARVMVNSGGEGGILVCDQNGHICNGDLLVSSALTGLAMRQGDDIVRSCTVAKATSSCHHFCGSAGVLVGCAYMC